MLASALLDLTLHPGENESLELHFPARVVDIDTDQVPFGIIIEHDAFRDLTTLNARMLGEIDVQRIGVGIVGQLHGRNPRSGNAVSYTHLRAHETPEHLVCRLLL